MPVFIHSRFCKNESLNLKRTDTVFFDYKHQLSVAVLFNMSSRIQTVPEWVVTEKNNIFSDG